MTARSSEVAREFLAGYPLMYEDVYPYVRHLRGFTRLRNISWKLGIEVITSKTEKGYRVETLDNKPVFADKEDVKYYFFENSYFAQLYNELLDADVFCDVGGYYGFYSLISQASKNYCFEADPKNLEKSRENFELNKDRENYSLEIVEKAVWSNNDGVNFYSGLGGESTVSSNGEPVESITLDTYFEDRPDPDVVKIDVEGGEGHVLEGAERLLKRSHPTLFIEFHFNGRLSSFGHSFSQIKSELEALDYSLQVLEERESAKLVKAK